MAFEVTDEWTISRKMAFARCLNALSGSVDTNEWVAHPRWEKSRKPALISLSVSLHAGFLYLLVQHGLVPTDDLKRLGNQMTEARLAIFELTPPPKPAPLRDLKEQGSGKGAAPTAPNVAPVFNQSPVMLTEWSVARIAIARNTASTFSDVTTSQGFSGTSGTGSGQGNGAGFDPYAGASPQRRPDAINGASGANELSGSVDPRLDRDAFAALVEKLRDQLGLTRGTVLLAVDVTSDGRIKTAEIKGGDANVQLKLFVRMAVTGEKLFRNGTVSRHEMPPIRI